MRLCTNCDGTGEVKERTSAYESEIVDCSECGGSGRIIVLRFRKEIPYTKKSIVGKYKSQINELLNELENELKQ